MIVALLLVIVGVASLVHCNGRLDAAYFADSSRGVRLWTLGYLASVTALTVGIYMLVGVCCGN